MTVLIITRSDDNRSIPMVEQAIEARGGDSFRLMSDWFPLEVQLATRTTGRDLEGTLKTPDGEIDLGDIESVWYRRFHAAAKLPADLGDTRPACVGESRRHLFGFIAALPCFHLDPIESVRRTDHKELQLRRAQALGLEVPPTLLTNNPDAVRAFYDEHDGDIVTKMQHSFAIYREGRESVVYTTPVTAADLEDLSGLRFSPMTFQTRIEKKLELRATVVGEQVFTASIDSTRRAETSLDWRRDGVGLIEDWQHFALPSEVEAQLKALVSELGLNYAACDFIVTPDDRLVFLEVNAVGEFFWLQAHPGLPIVEAIADVLLGKVPRRPVDVGAWTNHV
jgi:hypothetical protein